MKLSTIRGLFPSLRCSYLPSGQFVAGTELHHHHHHHMRERCLWLPMAAFRTDWSLHERLHELEHLPLGPCSASAAAAVLSSRQHLIRCIATGSLCVMLMLLLPWADMC
jgi:hypothetical protein